MYINTRIYIYLSPFRNLLKTSCRCDALLSLNTPKTPVCISLKLEHTSTQLPYNPPNQLFNTDTTNFPDPTPNLLTVPLW